MKTVILLFLLIVSSLSYGQQPGMLILNKLDTIQMYQDSVFNHNYVITGDWQLPFKYELIQNSGGELDSAYGFFKFEAFEEFEGEAKYYDFIVRCSNFFYADDDTFTIVVHERLNKLPVFSPEPDSIYYVGMGSLFYFDFTVIDPEGSAITVDVSLNGVCGTGLGGHIFDDTTYDIEVFNCLEGATSVIITYSDGHHFLTKELRFMVGNYTEASNIELTDFELISYPNPVQDIVYFDFKLPSGAVIDIDIYNLTGQLIEKVVSGYFDTGKNRISYNSSALTAGTYLCRFRQDGELLKTLKVIKN